MSELPKTFEPGPIEARWYAHWEGAGLFRPERSEAEPFTIVMPPPNVTGSLHIGHALDNTLQDILIRRARMDGKDALWVVGMDHAGIATQMVVERNLAADQKVRTDFTRDEFVAKVWEWKAESGGQITRQLRRLGASCDWANERFTMDEGFSKAVLKVFVELYKRKLLYRAKRLVNWDPKFQTAISDLEVENREVQGHMWHFKYPLAGGETYTYVERDEDGKVRFEEQRDYISIATTRPETMLGDGAVAVHPDDERYRPIVGKYCEIPVGPKEHRRLIPIITDDYPDPNFGSGAVKITGAHDLNDYGVAQRNGIPMYRLMDGTAHMRADGPSYADSAKRAIAIARGEAVSAADVDALNLVPEAYRGLDRYSARNAVVADIDADGLMIKVEDKMIMQPFGDRSGLVIEPMLTDQWYVDAATLAKPAIEAVKSGDIAVVPETWKKTWFNWLDSIQPWCVSRQLWWGHRIPVWYFPPADDEYSGFREMGTDEQDQILYRLRTEHVVSESQSVALNEIARIRGVSAGDVHVCADKSEYARHLHEKRAKVPVLQDQDVLDTWFSSALWPFATLGWPDQTEELKRHYPNDVLISGFDIIFFWDARMAMQGFEFMGERPWKTLYLHGLVRDAAGQKMSKSKGNTVDPLGLIDKYGADALRFTMAAMESQGRDIKLDEKRVEGYRNFATKLWNAARFLQGNGVGASQSIAAPDAKLPVNRWIIGEVVETLAKLNKAFDELRFDGMADAIYHFTWGTFCDWYVELVKGELSPLPLAGGEEARSGEGEGVLGDGQAHPQPLPQAGGEQDETRAVAAWAFDQILVMLHPFMPFVTEELWHAMGTREADGEPWPLITAKWPEPKAEVDAEAKREIEWLIGLISGIRSARTDLNVPPGQRLEGYLEKEDPQLFDRLAEHQDALVQMAKVSWIATLGKRAGPTLRVNAGSSELVMRLQGVVDVDAERARLKKAVEAAAKDRDSLAARLANPAFTERAAPQAVEKARADHDARAAEAERLAAALARLG